MKSNLTKLYIAMVAMLVSVTSIAEEKPLTPDEKYKEAIQLYEWNICPGTIKLLTEYLEEVTVEETKKTKILAVIAWCTKFEKLPTPSFSGYGIGPSYSPQQQEMMKNQPVIPN